MIREDALPHSLATAAEAVQTALPERILFISYHFPPSAAVGGRRIANFAAELRRLGWQPHVLTITDENVEQLDPARLGEVEGIPIHKARVLPTGISLVTALSRMRSRPSPETIGQAVSAVIGREGSDERKRESVKQRLRRALFAFLLLPDGNTGWLLPAIVQAVRTIRRHRLNWIMTSCPPYSVHLVGLGVKLLTGARWVVDFRDPWMTTGSKRLYPTTKLSMKVESWLEKQVIQRADLVTFNVRRLRDAYCQRYSHVRSDKFVFIPNALASRPDTAPGSSSKYETFTISYTGSLYVGRSPEPVFRAVRQLIDAGSIPADAIRIRLVGHCSHIDGVPTGEIVRRLGLETVVEVKSPVPQNEAFEIVRRSHLALLLAPNLPYQIPAKVYDYLSASTRILAIAEEGGTADLLTETGAGRAFESANIGGIADFILSEFASRSQQPVMSPALQRYELARITGELVGHLGRVVDSPQAGQVR